MDQGQGFDPDVCHIPIPSAMPEKVDLQAVPTQILRSGAVEALINQNDDLMARLSVALRRSSQMEQAVQDLENQRKIWSHQLEVLRDKLLLVQEKEKMLRGRDSQSETLCAQLKEELRFSELRYVELCTTSKERSQQLLARIEHHGRRLQRLLKYRARIRRLTSRWRAERIELLESSQKLQLLLAKQDVRVEDLQRRVDEMTVYIQTMGSRSNQERSELACIYEDKLMALGQQLGTEREQHQSAKDQLLDHERTHAQNIELKNQLITATRAKEETARSLNESIRDLQQHVRELRTAHKADTLRIENQRLESEALKTAREQLVAERERLKEQVESLQVLWADAQKSLESKTVRIESLQQLNQNLSISLNTFRKDNEGLKQQIESHHHLAQDRLRSLRGEMQMAHLEPEIEQRIHSLLSEMGQDVAQDL